MSRSRAVLFLAAIAAATLHFSSIPRTIWEYDECIFASAVQRFEPLLHKPHPPGFPLFIGFAKLLAPFTDPFHALVITNAIAVIAGFFAFAFAFRAITDDETLGALGALVLYASPSVLVSATPAFSDAGALALMGVAAWAAARGRPGLLGIACAAAVGWRPQFAIAIVPLFLGALVVTVRTWRERLAATTTFGVACLAWLVPLVIATGGVESFWTWLSSQATYYAQHDADLSRSGHGLPFFALRFAAHPWGPKWLSIPFLAIAVIGAVRARRFRGIVPLAAGCLVYLAFAIATMDPADAVRYAIPSMPLMALLMVLGAATFRVMAVPIAILYAAGATWYAWPVLRARETMASPPYAAAQWIHANVPKDAVVLYDLALRPHAEFLLRGWKTARFDATVPLSGPVYLYADGPGAVTFRWPDSDAYRKLTRQHYATVSVTPFPPAERFRVVEGVFSPERSRDGLSWRWIAARGTIELPDLGAKSVRIVLRAPPEYPLGENRVAITIHGHTTWLTVQRGASSHAVLPIPAGPVRITLTPERTFVPAEVTGGQNRDRRRLGVMLERVEQK